MADDAPKEKATQPDSPPSDSTPTTSTDASAEDHSHMELPPADFSMICMIFGMQAMVALGVVPDPTSSKPTLRLDAARHFIDLLSILETKTKGNLTNDEQQLLTSQLHELRMLFVQKQKEAK